AEELRRLGIPAAEWHQAAVPLHGMEVIVGDDSFGLRYADPGGERTAWGLDRRGFDALLAARAVAAGSRLTERTAFQRPVIEGGRVTGAILRDSNGTHQVRSRWLVGADGALSRVARSLGVSRPARAPRRLGLVARYQGAATLNGHGEMHVGRGFY